MFILFLPVVLNINVLSQPGKGVRLVKNDKTQQVEIFVDGKLFTVYRYSSAKEKPFLFPVIAPDGSVVTRGFPIEPRKGERVDHPHQTGLWFNYGNINGLDFWNNSSAIPAEKKDAYGHIVVKKIEKAESGREGILEVYSEWQDNKGNVILDENTRYIFSGTGQERTIDHISTLTAVNGPVRIADNKEGLFAIRVDRALEMPSDEQLIFTDDKGNPTTVAAADNKGVTGMYTSSRGLRGDAVWGTRNEWVCLTGQKNGDTITLAIFDHPKNTGFPAYFHARGYGLFSINNLGRNSYDPKMEKNELQLARGESLTLRHRFYVRSGTGLTPENADKIFSEFSKRY